MPHLHLCLQSGDDLILKRMKRRHSRGQAIETVARLKAARPGHRDRRRPHRRLSDRERGDAREPLRLIDECDIVHGPHLPLFAPARHAGGADAAGRAVASSSDARRQLREACAPAQRRAGLQGLVGTRQRVLVETRRHAAMPRISRRCGFVPRRRPVRRIAWIPASRMTARLSTGILRRSRHPDWSARVSDRRWYERLRLRLSQDLRPARRQSVAGCSPRRRSTSDARRRSRRR